MKRVLLTGASGYIGRHTLDSLLQRGYEVHAVSRNPLQDRDNVVWHRIDLLDLPVAKTLVQKVAASHLVHLAWVTDPGEYWQSPLNTEWLTASVELLEQFGECGGEAAVLAGTCAEYDWSDGHCVESKTPLRARTPYAEAKLAFRDAAYALSKITGLKIAWARLFFSFGPHERPERLVAAVIIALLSGDRAACVDGHPLRDFMYVLDLADALATVLDHGYDGDINIAQGEAIAVDDLVGRIAAMLDATERVDLGRFPRAPDDPQKITADVSRLRDVLGWRPQYDLDSALDETINWYRYK